MENFKNEVNDIGLHKVVFDRLGIFFFKYDVKSKTIYVPEETCAFFGCKKVYENMPYSFAEEFVAPEHRNRFIRFYTDAITEKSECVFEDITGRFYLCMKFQVTERDEQGNALTAIGFVENMSKLKMVIHQQEKYINAIISDAAGYMEINLSQDRIRGDIFDSRIVDDASNENQRSLYTGNSHDEFMRWWADNMLVSDRNEFLNTLNCKHLISCFEKGQTVVDMYYSSIMYNGKMTDNKQTYYLSKDEYSGNIVAMCVVYDLTEYNESARDIQRKNLIIQKLCDKFDAIYYVNLDKETVTMYRHDYSRYDQEDASMRYQDYIQRYVEKRVVPEDREKYIEHLSPEHIKNALKESDSMLLDYRVFDGEEEHYFSLKIVRDDTEEQDFTVIMGLKNLDELVKRNKLLKETMLYADHASKSKANFLSNMSHDMRTPMNAIIGYTALASTHLDEKEKLKEYLKKITSSSNHLLSLINDILDMSRIESGKVVLNENPEDLAEILHELRAMIQPQIYAKQMDFFIDTCDVKDEMIYCDKLRLKQVLLNIFTNAVKYTQPGGYVSVRIIQKSRSQNDYGNFEFHIKDNGRGMSEEFQKHLFEPFTREVEGSRDVNVGTGLGLSIVKHIVDMMNGEIEVKSELGKGSEFIVSLAFKLQINKQVEYDFTKIQGFRALVVDDDFHTCDTVSRMLSEIGMRPEFAMHGKEAILRAKQAYEMNDEFYVYIIDWMMPDINGIEIARRIRKEVGYHVPIIIVTAYDWENIEEEAKEVGVTAICEKPLFMSNLKKVLANSCGGEVAVEIVEEHASIMDFTGKKLLLAEDIEINQEIAYEILTEKGFEVTIADNGRIAVEMIQKAAPGQYDLVLMDIRMPEMNGYQATKAIRELDSPYKDIPIVAMTANAFEDDRQMSFRMGMNEHVSKPLDEEHLFTVLSDLLGQS